MMRYTLERNAVIVHENAVEGTTTVRWSGGLVDIPAGATGRFEPVTASAMPKPSDASLVDQWMQDLPRFSVSADRRGTMLQTDFGEFVYREHVEALLSQIASARAQEPRISKADLVQLEAAAHHFRNCATCAQDGEGACFEGKALGEFLTRFSTRSDTPEPLRAQEPGQAQALPMVEGVYMDRSIADFQRACLVQLDEEQHKIAPDTALIGLLCDAVRCSRELSLKAVQLMDGPASSASQEPSPGWQPIETAPKDGTSILVGGGGCPDVHENAFRVYGKGPAMLAGLGNKQQPTHWMPLPSPPVPPTPERSRDHEF